MCTYSTTITIIPQSRGSFSKLSCHRYNLMIFASAGMFLQPFFMTAPHTPSSGRAKCLSQRERWSSSASVSVSACSLLKRCQVGGFSQRAHTIISCPWPVSGFNRWLQNVRWFNIAWRKWLYRGNTLSLTYIHGLSLFFMCQFPIHSAGGWTSVQRCSGHRKSGFSMNISLLKMGCFIGGASEISITV